MLTLVRGTLFIEQPSEAKKPGAPSKPVPANSSTNVSLTSLLAWQAASGATSYDVYFGTSTPPPLAKSTAATSYQPPVLETGIRCYWKVLARNSAGATESPVWSFKTTPVPGPATGPWPAAGATGVTQLIALLWQPGAGATSYDVYFGTVANPPKVTNVTNTFFTPPFLQAHKKYYWKVVSRSATGSKASPVWSFTTQ